MAKLPNWLIDAMVQAENNAEKDKLPIVCLIEKGKRGSAGMHLAVIRLETYAEWHVNKGE